MQLEQYSSEVVASWNAYSNEGSPYVTRVKEKFEEQFGSLQGVSNIGVGIYHGGGWVIDYSHPFIFDHRIKPPSVFMGIHVSSRTPRNDYPPEFQVQDPETEYLWAYQRYEAFVDRSPAEIRAKLGKPNMSREEMLDALSPNGNFEKWKQQCSELETIGKIPPYRSPTDKPLA